MVKDWNTRPIGELLDFKNGLNKGKQYFGHGTPIINYTDVYHKRGLFAADVKGTVELSDGELRRYAVRKGDVFFTRTSETPEEVGISSVLLEDIRDCAFSGFVLRGRPKTDDLVPEYCKYCFSTKEVRDAIVSGCTYTTRALTNGKLLSSIDLPIPDKNEQREIATALSDVDELILNLEKLIEKKTAIKQGAIQQLITGKTRLAGHKGDWQTINMSSQSKLKARIGWQGLTTAEYLDAGYSYLVTGTDFDGGRIDWSRCHFVSQDRYVQDPNIQIENGDVLLTKDGTIGKVALVDGLERPATLNSGVFVIRPLNKAYSARFLYYVLSSSVFEDFLDKLAAGSTISHLYQKDLVEFEFYAPPTIEEQEDIASLIYDMECEIRELQCQKGKYVGLKQGMMNELLTGRTRLI